MKIAIDARMILEHPTGIGRVVSNLVRSLAKVDHENEYFVICLDYALQDVKAPNVHRIPVKISQHDPKVYTHLPGIIKDVGAELVHYHYYITPLNTPIPSVVTVHGTVYSQYPKLLPVFRRVMYNLCMRHSMNQSSMVTCVSNYTADDVRKFFPSVPQGKIRVVYNGVESRFSPPEMDTEDVKAKLGLPGSYIMYMGNHRKSKNIEGLIKAFSMIKNSIPHYLLLPTAAGKDSLQTVQAVAEHGLTDRVVFHEMPDEDQPAIYGAADLFVFPSINEGFGLPVLEAMACGTPVITSNTSSLPEVVGDAAVMVDPLDSQALAESMIDVLRNPDLQKDMVSKGLERAKIFTWERCASEMIDVYRQALGNNASEQQP
jgi:glycosyltransferase involved in cell wall biosynthesis